MTTQTEATLREALKRLQRQLERTESRNADLRAQLEAAVLGKVKAWTPFVKCDTAVGGDGQLHQLLSERGGAEVWKNSIYTVTKWDREFRDPDDDQKSMMITWLSIKRNDGTAIRDWRHFQRIKNELCGPEREGVEIFPAESRLVDGANQFHLWILPPRAVRVYERPTGERESERRRATEALGAGCRAERLDGRNRRANGPSHQAAGNTWAVGG